MRRRFGRSPDEKLKQASSYPEIPLKKDDFYFLRLLIQEQFSQKLKAIENENNNQFPPNDPNNEDNESMEEAVSPSFTHLPEGFSPNIKELEADTLNTFLLSQMDFSLFLTSESELVADDAIAFLLEKVMGRIDCWESYRTFPQKNVEYSVHLLTRIVSSQMVSYDSFPSVPEKCSEVEEEVPQCPMDTWAPRMVKVLPAKNPEVIFLETKNSFQTETSIGKTQNRFKFAKKPSSVSPSIPSTQSLGMGDPKTKNPFLIAKQKREQMEIEAGWIIFPEKQEATEIDKMVDKIAVEFLKNKQKMSLVSAEQEKQEMAEVAF